MIQNYYTVESKAFYHWYGIRNEVLLSLLSTCKTIYFYKKMNIGSKMFESAKGAKIRGGFRNVL